MKEFLQCPSCKRIHGEKYGIQPPGEMIYHVLPYSLPGYPECDTIRILYDIHSGIQVNICIFNTHIYIYLLEENE